jgi:hypothetical protein
MEKWNNNFCLRNGALILLVATMVGCAIPFSGGYGEKGLSRQEFARYVEDVFRAQNKMTSEVMMLLASEDGINSHEDLLQAERQMHEVCAPLNEYAARDIEGRSIGLVLRRNVEKSVSDCEQAALRVKALLQK